MDILRKDYDFTEISLVEESSMLTCDVSIAVAFDFEWLELWWQDSELVARKRPLR